MKIKYNFVTTKPHGDVLPSLNAPIDIRYDILLDLLVLYRRNHRIMYFRAYRSSN